MKESEEQALVFKWASMVLWRWPCLKWMYHCPNGGSRNKAEAARLKAQGVKAGVPDIFLPHPKGGYHGLYIELKTDTGNATEEQKDWLRGLSESGYYTDVCHGFDEAGAVIENYLTGGSMKKYLACENCKNHDPVIWCKKYGDDPEKADKSCRESHRVDYRPKARR